MRKEKLLNTKKEVVETLNEIAFREEYEFLNEDILKQFSVKQLETIVKILNKVNITRDSEQLFYPLSVNECVHRDTGKIIYVDKDGVEEMTEDEIKRGAACRIYEKYKKRMAEKKSN